MNLNTKLQHRTAFQPTGLLMREGAETPTIDGVAIVVNKETVLYEGSDWREVEVIDPSCITDEFIKSQDIKLNLLHERSLSFARTGGSLILETREDGLHFSAPGDDSAIARQATDLIKNGTYTGCSFEFWAKDYQVSERVGADGKTEYVIRHQSFERIGAITIGMDPAYEQTSVGLREKYQEEHPAPVVSAKAEDSRELETSARLSRIKQMEREIDLAEIETKL